MILSKEQLLIPRVLVIGGKEGEPNDTSGDFITGDILTQSIKNKHRWHSFKLNNFVYLNPDFVERFPHLFRKLAWCDLRDGSVKVEFVRYKKTGVVLRASCNLYNGKIFFIGPSKKYEPGVRFEPSTKEEYDEYGTK